MNDLSWRQRNRVVPPADSKLAPIVYCFAPTRRLAIGQIMVAGVARHQGHKITEAPARSARLEPRHAVVEPRPIHHLCLPSPTSARLPRPGSARNRWRPRPCMCCLRSVARSRASRRQIARVSSRRARHRSPAGRFSRERCRLRFRDPDWDSRRYCWTSAALLLAATTSFSARKKKH